jgi:hypothetical protein
MNNHKHIATHTPPVIMRNQFSKFPDQSITSPLLSILSGKLSETLKKFCDQFLKIELNQDIFFRLSIELKYKQINKIMIASVHIFVNFVNQTFYASSHNCKKVLENIIIF